MIKRFIILILLLAAVSACFVGYKMYAMKKGMAMMMSGFAPPTVSTIKATEQDWQPKLDAVGSLRAVNGADLSSELSGIVEQIDFESSSDVEAGATLVKLRNEDDIAKLNALQAAEKIADINYQRDLKQVKMQAVAQAQVDNDSAVLDSAKAQVDEQQAVIDKKTIKAPFAGHLGIRQVDVGQYLNPGTAIVSLQQLDPIYVDFALPEQSLTRVAIDQKVTLHTDAFAGEDFTGKVTAINSKVDDQTRNIYVRATFANADHKLLPGMFGHVSIEAGDVAHYVTLPQTAVVYNTYGNTVYLVKHKDAATDSSDGNDEKEDGKVSTKPQAGTTVVQSVIITGETRGDQVAVLSGVKAGDEVVTSGQVKLRNGSPIIINNDLQPSNDANPTPHEQ